MDNSGSQGPVQCKQGEHVCFHLINFEIESVSNAQLSQKYPCKSIRKKFNPLRYVAPTQRKICTSKFEARFLLLIGNAISLLYAIGGLNKIQLKVPFLIESFTDKNTLCNAYSEQNWNVFSFFAHFPQTTSAEMNQKRQTCEQQLSTVKPVNYSHQRDWGKVVLIRRWSKLPGLFQFKFFMEVSIAKRPFEHILWPQVFNFR